MSISFVDKNGSSVTSTHFAGKHYYFTDVNDTAAKGHFIDNKGKPLVDGYSLFLDDGKCIGASDSAIGQKTCKAIVGNKSKSGACISGTGFTE